MDIFIALTQKRSKLLTRKKAAYDEYQRVANEIDQELRSIDSAIEKINSVLMDIVCPVCHGAGEVRRCDAAGDMEDVCCTVCHGTGIKV